MWSFVTTRGQRVALRDLPCVLGRERGAADVVVPHPSIAPRHLRVEADGDGLLVEALDDAALSIDGWPVGGARIGHGDDLVLGALVLRLEDDARGEVDPPSAAATRAGVASGVTPGGTGEARVRAAPAVRGEDELVLRKPAATASSANAPSMRGPTSPASAASRRSPGGADEFTTRGKGPLRSRRPEARAGLLRVDLGQLHPTARAGLVLGLLVIFALLAWGLGSAVGAIG